MLSQGIGLKTALCDKRRGPRGVNNMVNSAGLIQCGNELCY